MSLTSQEQLPTPRRSKLGGLLRCGDNYELRAIVLAELVGTALLVLLSCLPGCAGAPFALRAASAGLAVALLVQCFDHISGAMLNPTVLLAATLARKVPGATAAAMFVAQLIGATLGGAMLELLAPAAVDTAASAACLTLPRHDMPVYKAVCLEGVLGGLLALANMASWDARNRLLADSWPLRIGLSVAGLSTIAGELTGASMNPARSLGPALWSSHWEHHWVYWAGPLTGSLLCTLLYARVWAPAPPPAPRPKPRAAPSPPQSPAPRRRARVSADPAEPAGDTVKMDYSV
ncbi:aquaporin-like [Choristoneura fumiferana]|uniref:aquaporin-like n=1 Tax=Choristoneura fumiferana TaxID=7141 RepID=UPI003D1543C4